MLSNFCPPGLSTSNFHNLKQIPALSDRKYVNLWQEDIFQI